MGGSKTREDSLLSISHSLHSPSSAGGCGPKLRLSGLMTLSWRQLALCGAATALVGIAGYAAYESYKKNTKGKVNGGNELVPETTKATKPLKKKIKKKPAVVTNSESAGSSDVHYPPGVPAEMLELFKECDRSLEELQELNVEDKQRIFYGLLMKGEMHMNMSGQMDLALDCFCKAVSMVPNPGEIVAALEKTLPSPIFNALLDKIQQKIQDQSVEYYKLLTPKGSNVKFAESEVPEPGTTSKLKTWIPVAIKDASVGSTLWSESADATAFAYFVKDPKSYCEHCLKKLPESPIACEACEEKLYCSVVCRESSSQSFHAFFCKPPASVENALKDLSQLCAENNSSLPLLLLRYIAFLLSEEFKGNGAANNGPFAHYDHLRPVFRAPSDMDRQESKILRNVFTGVNKNVAEFLTDEIYTSMKSTLARHIFAVAPSASVEQEEGDASSDVPVALSRMECRQLASTFDSLSFFPIAAHLSHSCDPNIVVVCNQARAIRVAALKNIKSAERLTISYLPFASGTSTAERQLHLMRIFGFECTCDLCSQDHESP